jgi:hypothetical protein
LRDPRHRGDVAVDGLHQQGHLGGIRPVYTSSRSRQLGFHPDGLGEVGTLWVAQYRNRKIHQVDPQTGAILRTIESNRFVTGVTWVGDELWHGTWEADQSELRHIDSKTGEVLEQLDMPAGIAVSGLESNGSDMFFCGGGNSGKLRAVRRPNRESRVA